VRALSLNVWHGLNGQGIARFGELEPPGRRERRYALQERALGAGGFDIFFLQELNPVDSRAARLARALALDECHAVDQSGIKLFGFGLPTNLRSGIGILARPRLRLRSLGALTLSGEPFEIVAERASFQLREHRVALFAEATDPDRGRILLVNAHLHHGIEPSAELSQSLRALEAAGRLASRERSAIERVTLLADERRAREAERLLERVERLAHGCESILIGGDFNSTWRSTAYRLFAEAGFIDAYASIYAKPPARPASGSSISAPALAALDCAEHGTWNSVRNADNRRFSQSFPLPVPDFGRPEVLAAHRLYDLRPRRIDFLLARGGLASALGSGGATSAPGGDAGFRAGLFADQPDAETGLFLSDHFGVWADWPAT
jgi:endonuclease/exonuclease/phosphatase family metal-dependent hydrolase